MKLRLAVCGVNTSETVKATKPITNIAVIPNTTSFAFVESFVSVFAIIFDLHFILLIIINIELELTFVKSK